MRAALVIVVLINTCSAHDVDVTSFLPIKSNASNPATKAAPVIVVLINIWFLEERTLVGYSFEATGELEGAWAHQEILKEKKRKEENKRMTKKKEGEERESRSTHENEYSLLDLRAIGAWLSSYSSLDGSDGRHHSFPTKIEKKLATRPMAFEEQKKIRVPTARKRKVQLEQDVLLVDAQDMQQMDNLSSDAITLNGYYGTQQNVQGLGGQLEFRPATTFGYSLQFPMLCVIIMDLVASISASENHSLDVLPSPTASVNSKIGKASFLFAFLFFFFLPTFGLNVALAEVQTIKLNNTDSATEYSSSSAINFPERRMSSLGLGKSAFDAMRKKQAEPELPSLEFRFGFGKVHCYMVIKYKPERDKNIDAIWDK
ncbi:hypothetical protein RJT34_08060 [Clitoria ternatea]|uniref:Uncharacterized protein n=1 Tax=Clitoria ternatea TaxID=43366 RepID=A0AAN9PTV9_CLITE